MYYIFFDKLTNYLKKKNLGKLSQPPFPMSLEDFWFLYHQLAKNLNEDFAILGAPFQNFME